MMKGSFFPFNRKLVENENFKNMPASHRILFMLLVSEFNLRGSFYKSDLEVAVTIGYPDQISLETVRRARRKLQDLGWIKTKPGFLGNENKPVATTYSDVSYSKVEMNEFFAPIHRYAFDSLLYELRSGNLTHKEVLVFLYVCYFDASYRIDNDDFFILKKELSELTGLSSAASMIMSLNNLPVFGEETLFDLEDYYHKIKITKHRRFADPEEDENNRMRLEDFREDIQRRLEKAKERERKKRGEIDPEDLYKIYADLYQKKHGRTLVPGPSDREKLIALAESCGAKNVQKGIEEYFKTDECQLNITTKTRTIRGFLEHYIDFIAC